MANTIVNGDVPHQLTQEAGKCYALNVCYVGFSTFSSAVLLQCWPNLQRATERCAFFFVSACV